MQSPQAESPRIPRATFTKMSPTSPGATGQRGSASNNVQVLVEEVKHVLRQADNEIHLSWDQIVEHKGQRGGLPNGEAPHQQQPGSASVSPRAMTQDDKPAVPKRATISGVSTTSTDDKQQNPRRVESTLTAASESSTGSASSQSNLHSNSNSNASPLVMTVSPKGSNLGPKFLPPKSQHSKHYCSVSLGVMSTGTDMEADPRGDKEPTKFVNYCLNKWTHEETAHVLQQVLFLINDHQCDAAFAFPRFFQETNTSGTHDTTGDNTSTHSNSVSQSQFNVTVFSTNPNAPVGDKRGSIAPVVVTNRLQKSETEEGFKSINGYIIVDELGRGAQGKVKLAFKEDNPEELRAIKVIRKEKKSAALHVAGTPKVNNIHHEIAILKKLRHKHVVTLYEVIDDPNSNKLYLVMQYIERGPLVVLHENQSKITPLDVDVVRGYMRQLCAGLTYLHQRKIAHRDIKADNILLSNDGTVLLGDFGMSTVITSQKSLHDIGGTPTYRAPETFEGTAFDPLAADVWALGVAFYLVLFGELPFTGNSLSELREAIREHDPFAHDAVKLFHDRTAVRLLRRMLAKDASVRTTAHHCLKSSFLKRHETSQFHSGHHNPRVHGEEDHSPQRHDTKPYRTGSADDPHLNAYDPNNPHSGSPFKFAKQQRQQQEGNGPQNQRSRVPQPPSHERDNEPRTHQSGGGDERPEHQSLVRIIDNDDAHGGEDPFAPSTLNSTLRPQFSTAQIGDDDDESSNLFSPKQEVTESDLASAVVPLEQKRVAINESMISRLPRRSIASLQMLFPQLRDNDDDDDDDDDNVNEKQVCEGGGEEKVEKEEEEEGVKEKTGGEKN